MIKLKHVNEKAFIPLAIQTELKELQRQSLKLSWKLQSSWKDINFANFWKE